MTDKTKIKHHKCYKAWLKKNTASLSGKTVAITGSTGGLGKALCLYLASLGASLILVDRNLERSSSFRYELCTLFEGISVKCITADLEDISSVHTATELLKNENIDVFIHNAGAYSIPRRTTAIGYNNVFTINFASPYYMIKELLPSLDERGGKVVVVGSIAHNYSKTDSDSIDFSDRKGSAKLYGNAKRYLMFSLYELFKNHSGATLSVTHPGISFTGITNHYPRLIFFIIKHPMKLIFMRPKKASLSILRGVFDECGYCEWIGPRVFDIWGLPRKKKLSTCSQNEAKRILVIAEQIYNKFNNLC